ncbi:MAG: putative Ig domain-containing protein [Actinomycetota bacterium]
MKRLLSCFLVLVLSFVTWIVKPAPAHSESLNGVHFVTAADFSESTGKITFKEVPADTFNPVITPNLYGANNSAPTLSFNSMFEGQSYSPDENRDCQGATPLGCIIGNPSNPLSLSKDRYTRDIRVVSDSNLSASRGLGTQDNAAYSILFDKDVASVGLTIGQFDAAGKSEIKVFDRRGTLLGKVTNTKTGNEFFGFATDDKTDKIAGIQVSLVAPDDGYHIGDIEFVQKAYILPNRPPVVESYIFDQKVQEDKEFYFSAPTFSDPDKDVLTLSASLSNGEPLPSWLTFDPTTDSFSGTPPRGSQGSLEIKVTATDPKGSSVSTSFTLTIEPAPACEPPYILNPDNNHCYGLTDVLTWPKAREAARNANGYLATINDEGEQNWLINTFDSETVPGQWNPPSFWIGFTNENSSGQYQWVNGESVTYTNWNQLWGEPNNQGGNEHYADFCVRVGFLCPQVGVWNDRPDGWPQLKGIIEIEQP